MTHRFYDTCVLRLTRVRAQPQASKSVTRACIVFHAIAYALFQAQFCTHRLASVLPTLDCSCKRGHVANYLIGLLVGFTLQPARVPSYSVLVIPTRENTPRPEPVVCGCGPRICGEPSASRSQWSETASEGAAFLFNLVVGFAVGVCTCVTLCTHRSVSQEIIVTAEQRRSLPEGFDEDPDALGDDSSLFAVGQQ